MNYNKNWNLKIDPGVYKDVEKFPKNYRDKTLEIIESLPFDPYAGDIRKIKGGGNLWRRRFGHYRIFYEIHVSRNFIHVLWVERRGSKTY